MEAVLAVKDLTTRLRIGADSFTVVDKLSFSLEKGKTLALVGESGCGKSMTALSILRILPKPPALPPDGEVLFRGRNLLTLPEKEMRKLRGSAIAMIFQDPMTALNPVYTIGYQLLESAHTHLGLKGVEAKEQVEAALADVHMPRPKEQMSKYPHQLSGGMLQRAMIAMALICEPEVLIADEPTTALDVTIQAQILSLMRSLQERKGMALLLITHDMGVVAQMADEVIVMYATECIETAPASPMLHNPAHPYTQGLLQSLPSRPLRAGKLPTIQGSVPPLTHLPEGCRFHPRCPYVMEVCKRRAPSFFALPAAGHMAKCWLYDEHLEQKLHDGDAP